MAFLFQCWFFITPVFLWFFFLLLFGVCGWCKLLIYLLCNQLRNRSGFSCRRPLPDVAHRALERLEAVPERAHATVPVPVVGGRLGLPLRPGGTLLVSHVAKRGLGGLEAVQCYRWTNASRICCCWWRVCVCARPRHRSWEARVKKTKRLPAKLCIGAWFVPSKSRDQWRPQLRFTHSHTLRPISFYDRLLFLVSRMFSLV